MLRRVFSLGEPSVQGRANPYSDGLADNIEFRTYAGPHKGGNTTTVKAAHTPPHRENSYSEESDVSESEEQLVKDRGAATIQVTKSVQQQRD